ncbi:hypothetical protein IMCC3317_36310 [Kordia antarctica]|uniref:Uncharacterized protein n=1 Tax=Kordia antarctica TaxID=1218801 RepID=A0A7L4ZNK2_9FLAO|nr:hypothetical protein [Kordia antarctica]QHI38242.1 hypothetical protein IMCC3317_36310 [Kordia antarctica]
MLKNIIELKGIQTLTKPQQQSINGGVSNCIRNCRQDFADCRELGGPNCSANLAACKAAC